MNARKWTGSVFVALASAPLVCALALLTNAAAGQDRKGSYQEVDTEFIFGFTEGADVGEVGENEIEHQTIGSLAKRSGSYTAIIDDLRYEHAPFENFRFEIGGLLDYHSIAGVMGLDDHRQFAFDGVILQMRYRLLDREHAPFAFAVGIEPHWSRVDETSGEGVENFGGDIAVALDRELVKDKLFGAVNFVYDPEITRSRVTGLWQSESFLGLFGAATLQLQPGIFAGAEARYFRKYETLAPASFAGEALFVGPTMFVRFSKTFAISGSWGVQVVGHAIGDPAALDLSNFTRQQATFRLEYNF
jgi:hypothetical protein